MLVTLLNLSGRFHYESKKEYLDKSIRAETKQAISSLSQIGLKNKLKSLETTSGNSGVRFNSGVVLFLAIIH
mgnify:CR=1 FL=1